MFKNNVLCALKTACCSLLINKKHAVIFICCIVHCHDQIPFLAQNPFMLTPVLMYHHPGQWAAIPSLAMGTFLCRLRNQPLFLKCVLNPGITPLPPSLESVSYTHLTLPTKRIV